MTDTETGLFYLRIGVALTLLWSVWTKFTATGQVGQMMQGLGLGFLSSAAVVQVLAVVLLIVAIGLLVGAYVQPIGWFLTAFFTVSLLAGIFAGSAPFSVGPAIWKDFGLLGAALALAYGGAGANSADL